MAKLVIDQSILSGSDVQRLCDPAYENKSDQFRCQYLFKENHLFKRHVYHITLYHH